MRAPERIQDMLTEDVFSRFMPADIASWDFSRIVVPGSRDATEDGERYTARLAADRAAMERYTIDWIWASRSLIRRNSALKDMDDPVSAPYLLLLSNQRQYGAGYALRFLRYTECGFNWQGEVTGVSHYTEVGVVPRNHGQNGEKEADPAVRGRIACNLNESGCLNVMLFGNARRPSFWETRIGLPGRGEGNIPTHDRTEFVTASFIRDRVTVAESDSEPETGRWRNLRPGRSAGQGHTFSPVDDNGLYGYVRMMTGILFPGFEIRMDGKDIALQSIEYARQRTKSPPMEMGIVLGSS